jgi:hypothetical protein
MDDLWRSASFDGSRHGDSTDVEAAVVRGSSRFAVPLCLVLIACGSNSSNAGQAATTGGADAGPDAGGRNASTGGTAGQLGGGGAAGTAQAGGGGAIAAGGVGGVRAAGGVGGTSAAAGSTAQSGACSVDEDCQNLSFCDGRERCVNALCAPAVAAYDCDDGNPCTNEVCDTMGNGCVFSCNTSRFDCNCADAPPPCQGAFVLATPISYTCAGGLVQLNVEQLTFSQNGSDLVITTPAGQIGCSGAGFSMQQIGSSCATFDADVTCPGTCQERYRIEGTFTDFGAFTGTFSATFSGGFYCADCSDQTWEINGTAATG